MRSTPPSLTETVTVGTAPFQLATGEKVQAPLAAMVSVPLPVMVAVWPAVNDPVTPEMANEDTVRAPSTSESLVSTLPVAALSSRTVAVSLPRVAASLTAVTVMVSVDVAVSAPSVTV